MKLLLTVSLLLASVSSFAMWNEVECDRLLGEKLLQVQIEESFSPYKRAVVSLSGAADEMYQVYRSGATGFNRVRYSAPGMDLEVDFWPDRAPRWGRIYRGTLRSEMVGNTTIQGLNCRFPNAQ